MLLQVSAAAEKEPDRTVQTTPLPQPMLPPAKAQNDRKPSVQPDAIRETALVAQPPDRPKSSDEAAVNDADTTTQFPKNPSGPKIESDPAPALVPSEQTLRDATSTESKVRGPSVRAHPKYRDNRKPPYPASARRRGQEGTVILNVRVEKSGHPSEVRVQQSSGFSALDEAAKMAVSNWTFEPARVDESPVASEIEVPMKFQMK